MSGYPRLFEVLCENIIYPPYSLFHFFSVFTVECVFCNSMMPLSCFILLKIDCHFVSCPMPLTLTLHMLIGVSVIFVLNIVQ